MNSIYLLTSPVSGKSRYIGITKVTPEQRLSRHEKSARNGSSHRVHCWIRALHKRGMRPLITLLELTNDRNREVFWIENFRSHGAPLLNSTDRGDGLVNPSQWTRNKMSESAKKRPKISEETRALLRRPRGPHTEEAKQKMRGPKTPEHRANAAAAQAKLRASGNHKVLTGDSNPSRKYPEKVLRGSKNGLAKLNEQQVAQMRYLHLHGMSTVNLGKRFGVSQATAWRIVKGLVWRHVLEFTPPPASDSLDQPS